MSRRTYMVVTHRAESSGNTQFYFSGQAETNGFLLPKVPIHVRTRIARMKKQLGSRLARNNYPVCPTVGGCRL